jgi:hypothetical protein
MAEGMLVDQGRSAGTAMRAGSPFLVERHLFERAIFTDLLCICHANRT